MSIIRLRFGKRFTVTLSRQVLRTTEGPATEVISNLQIFESNIDSFLSGCV